VPRRHQGAPAHHNINYLDPRHSVVLPVIEDPELASMNPRVQQHGKVPDSEDILPVEMDVVLGERDLYQGLLQEEHDEMYEEYGQPVGKLVKVIDRTQAYGNVKKGVATPFLG